MDALARLNELPEPRARAELLRCCGSARWVEAMLRGRPYRSPAHLFGAARSAWETLPRADWLEAFGHHPKLGDLQSLKNRFQDSARWAAGEQAGAAAASEGTLKALAEENAEYERRFGFIFILCASGKSADEMLSAIRQRKGNGPEAELRNAANEQAKIIRLRLEKLLKSC